MSRVVVDAGSCGFRAEIRVERLEGTKVRIALSSGCEMLERMNADLREVDWRETLGSLENSLVYRVASRHISRAACPVPSAIVKAIEVEVGAALPAQQRRGAEVSARVQFAPAEAQ